MCTYLLDRQLQILLRKALSWKEHKCDKDECWLYIKMHEYSQCENTLLYLYDRKMSWTPFHTAYKVVTFLTHYNGHFTLSKFERLAKCSLHYNLMQML